MPSHSKGSLVWENYNQEAITIMKELKMQCTLCPEKQSL